MLRLVYFYSHYLFASQFAHVSSMYAADSSEMSIIFFFFSSRRRHTRFKCDWSSDVCSSDLERDSPSRHLDRLDPIRGTPERRRVEAEVLASPPGARPLLLLRSGEPIPPTNCPNEFGRAVGEGVYRKEFQHFGRPLEEPDLRPCYPRVRPPVPQAGN